MTILTAKELAAVLKLREKRICYLAAEGKVPGFKIGKAWRFDIGEIETWLAGMQRNTKVT